MASLRRTPSTSPAFPRCSRTSSGWLLLAATSLLLILPIDASGQTRVVHEEGFSTIKEARQLETHYKELIDRKDLPDLPRAGKKHARGDDDDQCC